MVGTTIVAGFRGEHLVATDLFIRSTSSRRPQTHFILFCRRFAISQPNYTSQSCNNLTKPSSPTYAISAVPRTRPEASDRKSYPLFKPEKFGHWMVRRKCYQQLHLREASFDLVSKAWTPDGIVVNHDPLGVCVHGFHPVSRCPRGRGTWLPRIMPIGQLGHLSARGQIGRLKTASTSLEQMVYRSPSAAGGFEWSFGKIFGHWQSAKASQNGSKGPGLGTD